MGKKVNIIFHKKKFDFFLYKYIQNLFNNINNCIFYQLKYFFRVLINYLIIYIIYI